MSGSSSKTKPVVIQKDQAELDLQDINLDIANQILGAIGQQADFQSQLFDLFGPEFQRFAGSQETAGGLGIDEATQQAIRDAISGTAQQQQLGTEAGAALSALLQGGGAATPEERALIEQAIGSAREAGTSDINRFLDDALQNLTSTLAPGRGLRPDDSPVLAAGGRAAEEAVRQIGQLNSGLAGQQAQALLNFPLARGEFLGNLASLGQGIQQAGQNFLGTLSQNAFANRLGLLGTVGQSGLGLSSLQGLPNLQQAFKPVVSQKSKSASGGISSKKVKRDFRKIDAAEVLRGVESLPVERWRYLWSDEDFIGTYAEDFQAAFGVGDGQTIDYLTAIGVLMASVQALAERVRELEEGAA